MVGGLLLGAGIGAIMALVPAVGLAVITLMSLAVFIMAVVVLFN